MNITFNKNLYIYIFKYEILFCLKHHTRLTSTVFHLENDQKCITQMKGVYVTQHIFLSDFYYYILVFLG